MNLHSEHGHTNSRYVQNLPVDRVLHIVTQLIGVGNHLPPVSGFGGVIFGERGHIFQRSQQSYIMSNLQSYFVCSTSVGWPMACILVYMHTHTHAHAHANNKHTHVSALSKLLVTLISRSDIFLEANDKNAQPDVVIHLRLRLDRSVRMWCPVGLKHGFLWTGGCVIVPKKSEKVIYSPSEFISRRNSKGKQ